MSHGHVKTHLFYGTTEITATPTLDFFLVFFTIVDFFESPVTRSMATELHGHFKGLETGDTSLLEVQFTTLLELM